ncbi:MAG: polysaccharide biosynthesis C-terminal domain-containing protein, partial [Chloroflexota bacterium]
VNSIGGDSAIFIINFYLNPIGIAFYEIAEKIPEGVDDLLSSFDTVYYPSISTLFAEEKPAEALLVMNKSAALMTGLMSIICVGAFLFGEMMIGFIFSEKYVSVSLGMTLSMVAVLFGMVGNIFGYTLVSADKPHTSTVTNTISVFIFILGALLLVPPFGFIGAIWASVISNLFDVIIYAIYLQKYHLKPQFWRIFQPLLLGVLFCVGVALLTPVNWLIRVGLMSLYPLLLVTLLKDFRQLKRYLPTIKATIAQRANGILSSRS